MMSIANFGPFFNSQQKKPVVMVKRANSAKNLPKSALRSAIMPKVQTIEITTSVQNSQLAASVIVPAHELLTARKRSATSSSSPAGSIAAFAAVDAKSSGSDRPP